MLEDGAAVEAEPEFAPVAADEAMSPPDAEAPAWLEDVASPERTLASSYIPSPPTPGAQASSSNASAAASETDDDQVFWVQCDRCEAWHEVSRSMQTAFAGETPFFCRMVSQACQRRRRIRRV